MNARRKTSSVKDFVLYLHRDNSISAFRAICRGAFGRADDCHNWSNRFALEARPLFKPAARIEADTSAVASTAKAEGVIRHQVEVAVTADQ
jgi:hypothetical protein